MMFGNPYSRLMAQTGVTPQPAPGPLSLMMPAAMGPSQPGQMPVGPMTPAPPQPTTQAAYEGPNVGTLPSSLVSNTQAAAVRERPSTPVGPMMGLMNSINDGSPLQGLGGLGAMTFDDDPATLADSLGGAFSWLGNDIGNMFGGNFGGGFGGAVPWGPSGQVGGVGMLNDLVGDWGAWMG